MQEIIFTFSLIFLNSTRYRKIKCKHRDVGVAYKGNEKPNEQQQVIEPRTAYGHRRVKMNKEIYFCIMISFTIDEALFSFSGLCS